MPIDTLYTARVAEKSLTHPCYSCRATDKARIHLPVAPECNIQCNFCLRKYDCVNESRPGVTSRVLTPAQAFERFQQARQKLSNLTVVGIAGPGDPLANFDEVRDTLELVRAADPEITFCLSTNGLMLPVYADELLRLGVTHVTVTVNAADTKTGALIYRHIDYHGQRLQGEEAADILLRNQLAGIQKMAAHGVAVKTNIVLIKGINDESIPSIIQAVKRHGSSLTNIMRLIPVKGSAFENREPISAGDLNQIRKASERLLPQMVHCRQCRADAVGTLGNDSCMDYAAACQPGKQVSG